MASTLILLEIRARISNAPHSKQSIVALGTPILRYSQMPLDMDSDVIKKKLSLSSFNEAQRTVIIKKLKV